MKCKTLLVSRVTIALRQFATRVRKQTGPMELSHGLTKSNATGIKYRVIEFQCTYWFNLSTMPEGRSGLNFGATKNIINVAMVVKDFIDIRLA